MKRMIHLVILGMACFAISANVTAQSVPDYGPIDLMTYVGYYELGEHHPVIISFRTGPGRAADLGLHRFEDRRSSRPISGGCRPVQYRAGTDSARARGRGASFQAIHIGHRYGARDGAGGCPAGGRRARCYPDRGHSVRARGPLFRGHTLHTARRWAGAGRASRSWKRR